MTFNGQYRNETIEAIISELSGELKKMHDTCNWTKEMEVREKQINERIKGLIELRIIYDDFVRAQNEPVEKVDMFELLAAVSKP